MNHIIYYLTLLKDPVQKNNFLFMNEHKQMKHKNHDAF